MDVEPNWCLDVGAADLRIGAVTDRQIISIWLLLLELHSAVKAVEIFYWKLSELKSLLLVSLFEGMFLNVFIRILMFFCSNAVSGWVRIQNLTCSSFIALLYWGWPNIRISGLTIEPDQRKMYDQAWWDGFWKHPSECSTIKDGMIVTRK